jgi:hypothetical protein
VLSLFLTNLIAAVNLRARISKGRKEADSNFAFKPYIVIIIVFIAVVASTLILDISLIFPLQCSVKPKGISAHPSLFLVLREKVFKMR